MAASGSGLAIARHLVEQHGGTIAAHSDGLGLGTTCHPPACAIPDRDVCRVPRPAADDAVRLDGLTSRSWTINPIRSRVLAALLEQRGARCTSAADARSFVHLLNTQPLALLIADIAMPHVDGYELIARLRRRDAPSRRSR